MNEYYFMFNWFLLPEFLSCCLSLFCLCLGRFVAILIHIGFTCIRFHLLLCSCVQLIVVAMVIEALC